MSIVKSFAVGNGDMFYIDHNSDNFTIIDCCLSDLNKKAIVDEIKSAAQKKGISRFVSTHPDDDHLCGLDYLDDRLGLLNFYCVENKATKEDETDAFTRYCELRDSSKAFHLSKGCSRRWMNQTNDKRGSAGLFVLWPDTSNLHYKNALEVARLGGSPNDISIIMKYSLDDGAKVAWMGDLSSDFMEAIKDDVALPKVNILFAPHHGRESGRPPQEWLDAMSPDIVVFGEAPAAYLDYDFYNDCNTITQNSAGDITFECVSSKVHVYVSDPDYVVDFLTDEGRPDTHGHYVGTLAV